MSPGVSTALSAERGSGGNIPALLSLLSPLWMGGGRGGIALSGASFLPC